MTPCSSNENDETGIQLSSSHDASRPTSRQSASSGERKMKAIKTIGERSEWSLWILKPFQIERNEKCWWTTNVDANSRSRWGGRWRRRTERWHRRRLEQRDWPSHQYQITKRWREDTNTVARSLYNAVSNWFSEVHAQSGLRWPGVSCLFYTHDDSCWVVSFFTNTEIETSIS